MTAKIVQLPDGRVWLRVARRDWDDPLDTSYARHSGGRWNPPGSFPALYLNGDVTTAQMQVERMLDGYPATIDDLDNGLDGVWCRSACTADGRGRELAWFGAGDHAAARPVWPEPLPFGVWRDAAGWHDLGLRDQPDPIAEVD